MCLFAGEPVPHPHLLLQPQRTGCPDSSLHLWGPETTATMSVVCAPGLGGGGAMDAGCGGVPLCVQGWPEGCGSREEGRQGRRVLPPGKQGMESTPSDHRSRGPAAALPPSPIED